MNALTTTDAARINQLADKIRINVASGAEMREFFSLTQKSGPFNWGEMQNYLLAAGFVSVQDFEKRMHEKETEEFWQGLAAIGVAIVAAYALTKLLGKK